jgi:excisionase family DNA binding protein
MVQLQDELLTVAEAAKLLKVTRHTIYRWISEGRLPAVRYSPRVLRVRRQDLNRINRTLPSVGEPRTAYEARPSRSEVERQGERAERQRLLDLYSSFLRKPRPKGSPRKGSAEALLQHAGSITEEEGEELRRIIREAKTYSPPIDL